jgi:hypothetical protein
MRKHEIPAAIEKARTKRAERTELTADWVVDDRCGDLRFSWRIDHVGIMLESCWHHVGRCVRPVVTPAPTNAVAIAPRPPGHSAASARDGPVGFSGVAGADPSLIAPATASISAA